MSGDGEKHWDERIFELVDPGVDGTLIAENLKLSPGERIAKMLPLIDEMLAFRGSVYRK